MKAHQESKRFPPRGTPKILGKDRNMRNKCKGNQKRRKTRKSKKARIGGPGNFPCSESCDGNPHPSITKRCLSKSVLEIAAISGQLWKFVIAIALAKFARFRCTHDLRDDVGSDVTKSSTEGRELSQLKPNKKGIGPKQIGLLDDNEEPGRKRSKTGRLESGLIIP